VHLSAERVSLTAPAQVSRPTFSDHVLGKFGAANRTEAVTRARQLGLIS
jgi:DNA-binding CsgD family transcriptional regulator